jgi:hypothetical protein
VEALRSLPERIIVVTRNWDRWEEVGKGVGFDQCMVYTCMEIPHLTT